MADDCDTSRCEDAQCKLAMGVRLCELDRRIGVELKRRDEAVERAYEENREHLNKLNDLHRTMEKRDGLYLTRVEYDAKHETLLARVEALRQAIEDARAANKWAVGLSAICMSLVLVVLAMLWTHVGK
jgi:hypothetical protein